MNGDVLPVGIKNRFILSLTEPLLLKTTAVYCWPHEGNVSSVRHFAVFSVCVGALCQPFRGWLMRALPRPENRLDVGFCLLYIQQQQLWEEEPSVSTPAKVFKQSVVLHSFKSSPLSPLIVRLRRALQCLCMMYFVVFCSYMTDGGLGLYTRRLNRLPDSMSAVRETLHRNTSSGQGDADR